MDTGRDPAEVRARLAPWLARRLGVPGLSIGAVEAPATSGVANETLLVEACWTSRNQERRQGLAVRIAPDRPLFPGRSFRSQYLVQEALAGASGVPVPPLVGYEEDPAVLGSPFFVAERVDGLVPGDRPHFSEAGFVAEAGPEQRRRLWENAVDALARLHEVPAARHAFLDPGSGRSGLAEELHYWRGYTDRVEVGPGWNRDMLEQARPDARNESIQLLALWLDEKPRGSPVPRKPLITRL